MRQAWAARDAELRAEVRQFCRETMPADLLDKARRHLVFDRDDYGSWMRLLHAKGWATAHWPRAYGGLDWSGIERFVLEDELARQGCPWIIPFGVKYVGPVIYTYGTEAQRQRFLPKIATTEEWWAQGYSEPGAGSDLAALTTEAVRDGDDYLVNGQKVWTTYAQWADWMFCLARTSREGRKQAGISFLLIDMRTPGITVKPIRTMDGYRHVNEVWLENVRVPAENRIGAEGDGWGYGKFLLANERTTGTAVGLAREILDRLNRLARETSTASGRLIDRPAVAEQLAQYELRFAALEALAYRAVHAMMAGTETGAEPSILKIRGPELYQEISDTLIEWLGDAGGILKQHLYNRAATIFGGSSEVQRNLLAKTIFRL